MKIAEDVHLIASGAHGTAWSHAGDCNVYAVKCGEHYLLVDAGGGCQTYQLGENLSADGIPLESIRSLLLTHCHLDHAGGAYWLKENLGIEVCASEETAAALEAGDEEAISLAAAKKAGVHPADSQFHACRVDRKFRGGEVWTLGDSSIEVLRTPGHSRDMVAYFIRKPDRLILFSGDTVFHGGRILLSDIYDCDVPAYSRSLRLLSGYPIDQLFPGHMLWVVRDGHLHLRKTLDYLDRLLLPPNLI